MNSIHIRIATIAVAAVTLALGAAAPVQAAGLPNCGDMGATTPCFEMVWSNGAQVKMTFLDLSPTPSNAPTEKFYVMAPQTSRPQGSMPFLHDHAIGKVSSQHDEREGSGRYHGYFVLCSAQGISSGRCLPAMTPIPGFGIVPFARTVNGHKLTSTRPIESSANAGLITLFDTGGVLTATVQSRHEDGTR